MSGNITEDGKITIKHGDNCIVEASYKVPRIIANCHYNVNDTIVITYKPQQLGTENHEFKIE